jgi:hypothetical protein
VYPYPAYLTVDLGRAVLVRDFLTFPPLAFLALAFLLARSERNLTWAGSLMIIVLAIFLTYTRSIIAGGAACIAIAAVNEVVRRGNLFRGLIGLTSLLAVFIVGFFFLSAISPEAIAYLDERFRNLQGTSLEDSSLGIRFEMVEGIGEAIAETNSLLGTGLVPYDEADPTGAIYRQGWILGDIMWSSVLLYFGWAGVVVFGALLALGLAQSGTLIIRGTMRESDFALFLLYLFVQMAVVTMTGEGFAAQAAVGAMPFALLTVLRRNAWVVKPVTLPIDRFFSGISLRWFTQDDEYRFPRLAALAVMMAIVEILIIGLLMR